jgi:hypothetical protein
MKKFIFVAAVLLLAAPTWALDIWCEVTTEPNEVTVKYSGAGGENPLRGLGLDIALSGAGEFGDVTCLSADFGYQIYPGDIEIDGSGEVTNWGNCKCSGGYPGTWDDANHMTVEMGSLYEDGVDPDPCDSGDLVSFIVEGSGAVDITITVNEIRGGCVLEDATTTTPNITDCNVVITIPTCWEPTECGGQALGDGNCDGGVNFIDLGQLKVAFFSTKGMPNYDCCVDFNHDDGCNFLDLGILKTNFFTSGHTPATGNQDCPP